MGQGVKATIEQLLAFADATRDQIAEGCASPDAEKLLEELEALLQSLDEEHSQEQREEQRFWEQKALALLRASVLGE